MSKLKSLQARYKKGEISKKEYDAEIKKLVEEDVIDQETADTALEFDPNADKPEFTQADVDSMVPARAAKMVRKALRDAGIELDGVSNRELLAEVGKLAAAGKGKATDPEIEKMRKAAGKSTTLEAENKNLRIENAVLKAAGKFNPVNTVQVVRALRMDYMDLVEIDDETGEIDAKSVERALKKIVTAEPNLFRKAKAENTGEDEEEPEDEEEEPEVNTGVKGKGPGGGAAAASKTAKLDADFKEAQQLLGVAEKK
jgi:hypothetical protein